MRALNFLSIELNERLDEAGFRHSATALGGRLGAEQIGAAVYRAEAGDTIWPYHYHWGTEEWVLVIAGTPMLRDHQGQRQLVPGDVVCFPSGPAGVHTMAGPGRFMIVSAAVPRAPRLSVYPDSGKVSGPEGILLTSSRVEYWYGEGTWDSAAGVGPETPRARKTWPRQPIVNLDALEPGLSPDYDPPAGYASREATLGGMLGAQMLGATLYELDPGEGTAPYHYHSGREEWLLVLAGTPTVRHPEGEDVLANGDVVCFPDGPAGAHRIVNLSSETSRLLLISTVTRPDTAHYPDSGKLLMRDAEGKSWVFREADTVDYWEGEAGPR